MAIPLAAKASTPTPLATDDTTHDILSADPTVPQFPPGRSYTSNQYGYGINNGPVISTGSPVSQTGATTNINQSMSSAPVLTGAAQSNAVSDSESTVKADEHWVNKHWRPAMGWLYMTTCAFDFIIFPVLWGLLQASTKGQVTLQWQPLTLQGAGLYHMAMGTVLGVAAYGRTKEKMTGTHN